jgi:hypothetical protein
MTRMKKVRLSLLALSLVLASLAVAPVRNAEAAGCGSYQYFGCCYLSGGRVAQKEQRVCCDDWGNCWNETRCVGTVCAI